MSLVVEIKPIDCMWNLGLWKECPPWESFYGVLVRIYSSFGENHGKLRTARLTSALTRIEPDTSRLRDRAQNRSATGWAACNKYKKGCIYNAFCYIMEKMYKQIFFPNLYLSEIKCIHLNLLVFILNNIISYHLKNTYHKL